MTDIEDFSQTPIGHLQTDTFCETCGYNLHTQAVIRDKRLGILICRCPECGKWAAAGQGTSAGRVWLNRFGTSLLLIWVMFLMGLFSLTTFFLGTLSYGHLSTYIYREWKQVHDPRWPNSMRSVEYYTLHPTAQADPDDVQNRWTPAILMASTAMVLACFLGGANSVFLWHIRGWRRLLPLLMPVLAWSGTLMIWITDPASESLHGWGVVRVSTYLMLEWVAMLTGLIGGRMIARGILHLFVPPKLRQHLAFLWTIDGLALRV